MSTVPHYTFSNLFHFFTVFIRRLNYIVCFQGGNEYDFLTNLAATSIIVIISLETVSYETKG